ncbi:NAD(P)H-quinone oxidoreductase [Litorilituus lipolyticus]|uniref:NAD(P)H-quinone oxidoreductase n=1 Tax=Litorilituus lipolyticus TaxID=2491017 RepID=A0A502KW51_9GAMM|nr:NAD(P)H-quinone oxidoreductase [Litorilituus lipolyticus]TPH15852.1 NAD(P)H-quinone oxidoreductase [Litorilituus lipolyticus]
MKYIAVESDFSLSIKTTVKPTIAPDECLIKVETIGVNRADLLQRHGKYSAPKGESTILGLEVCGTIVACGSLVEQSNFPANSTVFCLVPGGGYAEYVKVKAEHIMLLPNGFSAIEGAALAEVFLTAYQSLFTLANLNSVIHHKKQNQQQCNVLIHAGASGVGTAAIQLAKAIGCFVTVTVGTQKKVDACLNLGADHAINYNSEDFVSYSKAHVNSGYDVIIDMVGGNYLQKNINVCALDGCIVMLAMLGGRYSDPVDFAKLLSKRITIKSSTLRNRSDDYKTELINAFKKDFMTMLSKKQIKPIIDSCLSWQEVEQAHDKLKNNLTMGKVILTVD